MARAFMGGTGPVIRFYKEDKPLLENGGEIEIKMSDAGKSVRLYISENPPDNPKIKWDSFMAEPYFRIATEPEGAGYDDEALYLIWLEKKKAKELLSMPPLDASIESRCSKDRVCISYFGL